MDYLTLCQTAWKECGLSGQGPVDVNKAEDMHGRIVDYVRNANVFVDQIHENWSYLWRSDPIKLVISQQRYSSAQLGIPEFEWLIDVVHLDGGQPAGRITPDRTSNHIGYGQGVVGRPSTFIYLPTQEWLFDAMPDAPYDMQVDYFRRAIVLRDNFDQPSIPEQYQHIIVWRAVQEYALFDEDQAMLQKANINYKTTLHKLEAMCLPPVSFSVNPFTGS